MKILIYSLENYISPTRSRWILGRWTHKKRSSNKRQFKYAVFSKGGLERCRYKPILELQQGIEERNTVDKSMQYMIYLW